MRQQDSRASRYYRWWELVFLSETWLKEVGDESKTTKLTPPGFVLKSIPGQTGSGGGLAILYRASLTKVVSIRPDCASFATFNMCEVRLQHQRSARHWLLSSFTAHHRARRIRSHPKYLSKSSITFLIIMSQQKISLSLVMWTFTSIATQKHM